MCECESYQCLLHSKCLGVPEQKGLDKFFFYELEIDGTDPLKGLFGWLQEIDEKLTDVQSRVTKMKEKEWCFSQCQSQN